MKQAIRSDWKASVIAGNSGNGFTADLLKAHLTIINCEIHVQPAAGYVWQVAHEDLENACAHRDRLKAALVGAPQAAG